MQPHAKDNRSSLIFRLTYGACNLKQIMHEYLTSDLQLHPVTGHNNVHVAAAGITHTICHAGRADSGRLLTCTRLCDPAA